MPRSRMIRSKAATMSKEKFCLLLLLLLAETEGVAAAVPFLMPLTDCGLAGLGAMFFLYFGDFWFCVFERRMSLSEIVAFYAFVYFIKESIIQSCEGFS